MDEGTAGGVQLLDLALETPEDNLALDEALLDDAERAGGRHQMLRIWESPQPVVVVGRSSRVAREVDVRRCRQDGVPILRRSSGGASVVLGPGCLNYSLVLSYEVRPALRAIPAAHYAILTTLAQALDAVVPGVRPQGTSDLTLGGRKFSGNSMRAKRTHLLYHGTLLYDFPLAWISRYLHLPPRQPAYRCGRHHEAFLTNLPARGGDLRRALAEAWHAHNLLDRWPRHATQQLVQSKYSQAEWNFRL